MEFTESQSQAAISAVSASDLIADLSRVTRPTGTRWRNELLRKVLDLGHLERYVAQQRALMSQSGHHKRIRMADNMLSSQNTLRKKISTVADEAIKKFSQDSQKSGKLKELHTATTDVRTSADATGTHRRSTNLASVVRLLLVVRKWVIGQEEENSQDEGSDSDSGGDLLDRLSTIDEHMPNTFADPLVELGSNKALYWLKCALHASVNPAKNFYYYWSGIIALFVLYNAMMLVARFTFVELQYEYRILFLFLDYLNDFVYITDMIIEAKKGFLEQGLMIRDPKQMAMKYVRSRRFYIDVFSILPTDLFYLAVGIDQPLVRINRIARVYRLFDFSDRTETRTNWPNSFRVLKLIIMVFVIFHWNACLYFNISKAFGIGDDSWVFSYDKIADPTILSVNNTFYTIPFTNLSKQYLFSLYWSALILMTLGEQEPPVKTGQYAFMIVDIIFGMLIFAAIVGNVASMISNMNASKVEFQERLDAVKQYMEYRKVHPNLRSRVLKWFDYMWSQKHSLDEETVTEYLPAKIKAEMAIQVHLETLRRVKIFQDCEPGLLIELVLKLKLHVFSPGDYICRKGDVGNEMYIVKRGSLNVVSDDGNTVYVTLKEGSVFGELSILNIPGNKTGNRRTASVRSVGYSDLFLLGKDDLWDALREYPEAKNLLLQKGADILRKDGLIDETKAETAGVLNETVDQKLERLDRQLLELEQNFEGLYEQFITDNKTAKQRVTDLEHIFEHAKHAIKKDILMGQFEAVKGN